MKMSLLRMMCIPTAVAFLMAVSISWSAPPPNAVPVLVAKAQKRQDQNRIDLPGTVLAWATTNLAAEIDGRVDEIMFNEGQYVKKGTPLIQLRTRPIELERDLAVAEKERVATELEELKAGTRKEVVEAARAALENAGARLDLGRIELKRIEELYKKGVLSINEYDNAASLADEAQAQFNEKKAQLDEALAGPRIETIKQAEANLAAAAARIDIIDDKLERATIYAPFDGYIVKKETEVGQWLEAGDPGVTMISANPVKVEVNLPQFYFDQVNNGTRAEVTMESRRPGTPPRKFSGTVIEKIQAGNPTSRTFPVRIKVKNPKSRIAPGMLVQVSLFPKNKGSNRLYVPKDALVRTPREVSVWVVRKGKDNILTAHKVQVTPGRTEDSMVAVETDHKQIKHGDQVVVHGNERLRPGISVKIIESIQ